MWQAAQKTFCWPLNHIEKRRKNIFCENFSIFYYWSHQFLYFTPLEKAHNIWASNIHYLFFSIFPKAKNLIETLSYFGGPPYIGRYLLVPCWSESYFYARHQDRVKRNKKSKKMPSHWTKQCFLKMKIYSTNHLTFYLL